MVLTQDSPCNFSTDEHQNSELSCQNVSAGPLLQTQDTSSSHEAPGEIFQAAAFPISVTPEMIK